jgi:DNA-binding beta-propeller fold protein YncE
MIPALLCATLLAAAAEPMPLPEAEGPIGFDDLGFVPGVGVLVPAGRTGRIYVIAPGTHAVASVDGFTRSPPRGGGHGEGVTSADGGAGFLVATDRDARSVALVDARTHRIVARAALEGGPDYVRWVPAAREVWVTEPSRQVIEIFAVEEGAAPRLSRKASIAVPGGPESLVIAPDGRRAYTNSFRDATYALDVASHAVAARWANRCKGARGIALDAARGLLFVGCTEGKVVALALRDGAVAGEAATAAGVDVIAYGAEARHVYAPGADDGALTVLAVGAGGELAPVGTVATAREAHCVTVDDRREVYVCDPEHGRLLRFHDGFEATPAR